MYMHAFLTLALREGQLHTHADASQASLLKGCMVDRCDRTPPPASSRIPIVMEIPGGFGNSKIMTFDGAQYYWAS